MKTNKNLVMLCASVFASFTTPIALAQIPSASPQQPLVTQPVFQVQSLNSAFRFTADEYNRAIDKGKQLAMQGKGIDEVYKSVAQMPRGVKGEKGKSHESVVYCTTLNAVGLAATAYKAANNYDPLPAYYSDNRFAKKVRFFVSLESDPKVSATDSGRNRTADLDDVDVTKFVLTDDKDNVIDPIDVNSVDGVETGTIHFWGTRPSQRVTTSERETSSGIHTTTRTRTSHVRWSVRHPYYFASYNVVFPLFDADGQPLIKTDTKSITLHIITPNGEKQVTYDLNPPKI